MSNPDPPKQSERQTQGSGLRQLAAWYEGQPIADFLRATQPVGTLVSVAAFIVAIVALIVTFSEVRQSRIVREAALFALAMERIEVAREMDANRGNRKRQATSERTNGTSRCSTGSKQFSARAGQIAVLERMVRLKIPLRDIFARNVNLVVRRKLRDRGEKISGINLEGADLWNADLRNTNLRSALLSGATLTRALIEKSCLKDAILVGAHLDDANLANSALNGADVSNADLTGADLYEVNLSGATLTGAILTNADITGADFNRAKGLKQGQLDSACAELNRPPLRLPKSYGNQLEWNPTECK